MSDHSGYSWGRLLQSLSDADGQAIHAAGAILKLKRGAFLFREGEDSDSMYVILKGKIQLAFEGVRHEKLLEQGAVIGELSLLLGRRRRSATAVAAEDTRLLMLDQGAVRSLLEDNPKLLVGMLRSIASYLLESERELIDELQRKTAQLAQTLDFLRRTQRDLELQEMLAETDELTGLYNRRCLGNQLPELMRRATEGGGALSMLALDVDDLKGVNDRHGHAAGDAVLRHVAYLLREAVRRADLPCRVGGDEFILLLADMTGPQARRRAEDIQRAVARSPSPVDDGDVRISLSIGGAVYRAGESASSFLERADRSLYAVKAGGKGRVGFDDVESTTRDGGKSLTT